MEWILNFVKNYMKAVNLVRSGMSVVLRRLNAEFYFKSSGKYCEIIFMINKQNLNMICCCVFSLKLLLENIIHPV
jgi:hypothetical protein